MKAKPPRFFLKNLWALSGVLVTGSLLITIIDKWWTQYSHDHNFPFGYWCIAAVIFVHFGAFLLMRKTLVKNWRLSQEIKQLRTPKLSIVFEETKPYIENVKNCFGECRIIRVGVKNNSLVKVSNVYLKLENCVPGCSSIPLKQRITLSYGVGPVSLGPEHERSFDLLTELTGKKHFYINLDIPMLEPMTDKESREIEISANCDESVPAKARFRIEPGPDGFFVMRRC